MRKCNGARSGRSALARVGIETRTNEKLPSVAGACDLSPLVFVGVLSPTAIYWSIRERRRRAEEEGRGCVRCDFVQMVICDGECPWLYCFSCGHELCD